MQVRSDELRNFEIGDNYETELNIMKDNSIDLPRQSSRSEIQYGLPSTLMLSQMGRVNLSLRKNNPLISSKRTPGNSQLQTSF